MSARSPSPRRSAPVSPSDPDQPPAPTTDQAPAIKRRSKRLPHEERRRLIVRQAADFFAEKGFDAPTRDLAAHLGVPQPLIYRFFSTKEDLINAIYEAVFLEVWDNAWDDILTDRSRDIADRLVDFYTRYTDVIMRRGWMRLYLFAGLKDVGITRPYIKIVEERVIRRIALEMCAAKGFSMNKDVEKRYMEITWSLQGSIFYYGVRKYVYGTDTHADKNDVIRDAVTVYIAGWPCL